MPPSISQPDHFRDTEVGHPGGRQADRDQPETVKQWYSMPV